VLRHFSADESINLNIKGFDLDLVEERGSREHSDASKFATAVADHFSTLGTSNRLPRGYRHAQASLSDSRPVFRKNFFLFNMSDLLALDTGLDLDWLKGQDNYSSWARDIKLLTELKGVWDFCTGEESTKAIEIDIQHQATQDCGTRR
jgi:hypothetical protein